MLLPEPMSQRKVKKTYKKIPKGNNSVTKKKL